MVRVILLEDDIAERKLFETALIEMEYKGEFYSSDTPERFLQLVQEINQEMNSSDKVLIFLDLVLPKFHGFEVLKKIQQIDLPIDTYLFCYTGVDYEKTILEAYDMGINAYIIKEIFYPNQVKQLKALMKFTEVLDINSLSKDWQIENGLKERRTQA